MKRIDFIKNLGAAAILGGGKYNFKSLVMTKHEKRTEITLIRHASLLITLGDKVILVDPMLSEKGAMDPVQNASNSIRIPMVELPFSSQETRAMITETDLVLLTHTHRDHWDEAARELIPHSKPLICQPADEELLRSHGFVNVQAVDDPLQFGDIQISRTGGQHGTGEIGKKMGTVSGFVIKHETCSIYIAGDTVWCKEVEEALNIHQPDIVVLNAGSAQFSQGDAITMNGEDVLKVIAKVPRAKVICVHMDTVNHCHLTRVKLREFLGKHRETSGSILIPADGESIVF
jgi:L-ascorbate metabolism protein UlaG (beta-lactamase superfamily)